MIRNYEQIRAKNAYNAAYKKDDPSRFAGVEGGRTVAKKVPAQIVQDGFLASLAYAIEKKEGYESVFKAVIDHLADPELNCTFGFRTGSLESFLSDLAEKATVDQLRAVTAESLAYLNYLRRFAKPDEKKEGEANVSN